MFSSADTIAALATPSGTSAVAVIRISGPHTAQLATQARRTPLTPRRATQGDYRDHHNQLIDDVIFTFYKGPASYTGEDSLEISTHGNPYIVQRILEDLCQRGCRLAQAGEFTQRAFLNGRLDLSQAEAVMDLIHARSERALTAANQQLRGSLGKVTAQLIDNLLYILAKVEAYIDFPEEDLPSEDRDAVAKSIEALAHQTKRLLATSHYGEILRDGIKTVIVGEPNAGKSSLLNRLVGHERALVSAEAGTTRDFIEERLLVGPHCLRLIDTAGLNPTPEPLEKLGMAKTLERSAEANLLLLVLDGTRPFPTLPVEVQTRLHQIPTLILLNKSDLPLSTEIPYIIDKESIIKISAVTGEGFSDLEKAIIAKAETFNSAHGDEIIAINARHADSLRLASTALADALSKLRASEPIELIASDLRGALESYGEIAGKVDNERMLDHLFASFCIGK